MINLEHKLTVDDLIVEYMIYKVQNGYNPLFSLSEFFQFLNFFENKMPVEDILYNKENLFRRFFRRKAENDWSTVVSWNIGKKQFIPHMDMIYSENDCDYIVKANYRLSSYDKSIINTYFMSDKNTVLRIKKIIGEYLANQPKRQIDETIELKEENLLVGKCIAAEIVNNIWNDYINKLVECNKWPTQCRDIKKYLLDVDLSEIIGIKSIKNELLNFYKTISKRIAVMYQQDKNLKISSGGGYLAKANYDILIKGYEQLFRMVFGKYKKSLNIDLSSPMVVEENGVHYFDESLDYEIAKIKIGDDDSKKLVMVLDENI